MIEAFMPPIDKAPAKTPSVPHSKPKPGKIVGKGRDGSSDTLVASAWKAELSKTGGKSKIDRISGIVSLSSQSDGVAFIEPHNPVSPMHERRDQTAASGISEPEMSRTIQRLTEPSPPREPSHVDGKLPGL